MTYRAMETYFHGFMTSPLEGGGGGGQLHAASPLPLN
jgi:hypothetical protein